MVIPPATAKAVDARPSAGVEPTGASASRSLVDYRVRSRPPARARLTSRLCRHAAVRWVNHPRRCQRWRLTKACPRNNGRAWP